EAALQEDVDVVGLSILSGAHKELFPLIMNELKKRELGDVIVIAGGIIPEDDHKDLEKIGVKATFGPGTPTSEIVDYVKKAVLERN
ncbi:MAG: methylmalonyl-CoA mutase, partial [Chloroflexi bacterium]|nr:methylmalonyl-CoA mutase [Chloroflexota bacterium]